MAEARFIAGGLGAEHYLAFTRSSPILALTTSDHSVPFLIFVQKACSLLWTMFSSLLRSLPQLGRRWKPLNFSNPDFVRIPESHKFEEETLPDYTAAQYYPTLIGEVIKDQYQVIGKLGFGSTSTAWLARDME